MSTGQRIYVAGHRGLVGSALVRALHSRGQVDLLLRTRDELDLRDPGATDRFFEEHRPERVYLAAAHVGGILANKTYPADFIHDNLAIQLSVIAAAHRHGVEKLLFLGSSCIYPREAPQPINESALLAGPFAPTISAYAVAKVAVIEMCQSYRRQYGSKFISVMPTNLYGPGDDFDLETSHVLPALIRKIHEAKEGGADEVEIWGSGTPRREFLHVDDLADACVFLMDSYDDEGIVNIGTGRDISIAELARLIADVIGYRGAFSFDRTKPDGVPRKLLDVTKLEGLGWEARIGLRDGIRETYEWYKDHSSSGAPVA